MMIKALDQQLFDGLYIALERLGYDVYVVLPDEMVEYPFVVLGDIQVVPKHTMSGMVAKFAITVDVWGDVNQRSQVTQMCQKMLVALNYLTLESCCVVIDANATRVRTIRDDSTQVPLWHGVVQLEMNTLGG